MKTEVKLTEAVGKTLAAVEFSESYCGGQCVLAFADGTFATLGVERGYESGDEEITEEPLSVFDFGDEKLIRAEIVTAEELAAMRKARSDQQRAEQQARQEARDRQEFERLKRKFGA
jgi:hypothetical protein